MPGLSAKVLLPDGLAAAVAARTTDLTEEFEPRSPYEEWLMGEMGRATARLERFAAMSIVDLQRGIDRATFCWEADRRKAADDLGEKLRRQPARVARAMSRSRQGADWKIERWEGLGAALKANGGWDDDQRRLAYDLLGVEPELRNGSDQVPAKDDVEGLAGLVAEEIGWLRKAQELSLDAVDEAEQSMALAGLPLDEDACTARLRRDEASTRRALHWARDEFRRIREGSPLPPAFGPAHDSPRTKSESRQDRPPLETRTPLSASSQDYLAKRSQQVTPAMMLRHAVETPVVATPVAEVKPEVKAPATVPQPTYAKTASFLDPEPGNRRERLARKKQERQAARQSSR